MSDWKVESSEIVLDASPFMIVRQEQVKLPNGVVLPDYNIISEPDIVIALVFTEANDIVLVEQYKHGIGQVCLELPGGLSDGGTPLEEIQREVQEETGYVSNEWLHLSSYINNPTRFDNYIHAFIARNARLVSEQDLDPAENITVRTLTVTETLDAVRNGQIRAVHSIATLFQGLAEPNT